MSHLSSIRRRNVVAMCALALASYGTAAKATMIPIANPGFDAILNQNLPPATAGQDIPLGHFVNNTGNNIPIDAVGPQTANVAAWVVPGDGLEGAKDFAASGISDPGNMGYLATGNGGATTTTMSQTLPGSVAFMPNTTYILAMTLLQDSANGLPLPTTFSATLTHGGTPVLGGSPSMVSPTTSTLGSYTFVYETGASAPGGAMGILLTATDTTHGFAMIQFDNITLNTPEPSSVVLSTMGIVGLIAVALRRKAGRKG